MIDKKEEKLGEGICQEESRREEKKVADIEEVKDFLTTLKNWLSYFGGQVLYDTRQKNVDFMALMEWTKPDQKKEWLLKLEPEDYFEGPVQNDTPNLNPYWVFGKRISEKLCYIKIYLLKQPNVYCISFHLAEYDISLPFKKITEKV